MFIPQAQPHTQSLFLFPIVFGINLIHFFDFSTRKKNGAAGNSIVCFAASIPCQSRYLTVRRMPTVLKSTWEELDKFKCLEAKCREKPWKVRARTYGTKSPSWSEALRFIDSAKSPSTKRATFLATESVNSASFKRGETVVQIFWQGKAQSSSPILRCTFLARRSAKLIANFSATMVTSLPFFSLSLFLSASLSLTECTSRTTLEALPCFL